MDTIANTTLTLAELRDKLAARVIVYESGERPIFIRLADNTYLDITGVHFDGVNLVIQGAPFESINATCAKNAAAARAERIKQKELF